MNGKQAALLTALLIMAAPSAYAQKDSHLFDRADLDRDGALSVKEFSDVRERRMAAVDADRDGGVNREEFLAAERKAAERRRTRIFKRFDRDGDGEISRAEFAARGSRAVAKARRSGAFTRIDRNGDGKISGAEFIAAASKRAERRSERVFRSLDKNRDGVISRAERDAGTRIFFGRIDLNGDGKVTSAELREARAKWRATRGTRSKRH